MYFQFSSLKYKTCDLHAYSEAALVRIRKLQQSVAELEATLAVQNEKNGVTEAQRLARSATEAKQEVRLCLHQSSVHPGGQFQNIVKGCAD